MQFSLESLASLATIAGLLITVFGIFQAREWLVLISLCSAAVAASLFAYARHMRTAVESASIIIEGHSIDALNIANLRRRVKRTLFIQEATHEVKITGEDMEIAWQYSGYCRAKAVAEMEFTINSEVGTRFEELHCVAHDLRNDPAMRQAIRPRLSGVDGISKKIVVPFLGTLQANEPFNMVLRFRLPRCARMGFSYYGSALSFGQDKIPQSSVRLTFSGPAPEWVRVYKCSAGSPAILIKALAASDNNRESQDYLDIAENRPGQSTWVYAFSRATPR